MPHVWLRDHCQCAKCRHKTTRQRTFDTATMSADIAPTRVVHDSAADAFQLHWPDGHESRFSREWLLQHFVESRKLEPLAKKNTIHAYADAHAVLLGNDDVRFFDKSSFPDDASLPGLSMREMEASPDDATRAWIRAAVVHGFAILRDTPQSVPATRAVLDRIGYFENTMFGDFWDFTANMALNDMAYTNEHLHVHTDGTYMPIAPYFQALHCYQFEGSLRATNTFVDGIAAAHRISDQSRDVLSRYLVSGRYSDATTIHVNCDTVLKHDAFDPSRMVQVRFNNEDRDTVQLSPDHTVQWYDAFLELAAQIRAPSSEIGFYMRPGWTVLFCNWRALHGRSTFQGSRKMCGTYHSLASVLGTMRAINERKK